MSLLNDRRMRLMHKENWHIITPYEPTQVREVWDGLGHTNRKIISYGQSSFGYDCRVDRQFKVFTNVHGSVVDPKHFDEKSFVDIATDVLLVPPNSFALGRTVETFNIPKNVLAVCLGKSTYARCGIVVNVTPFEPGWRGKATIEISNTTPLPARVYAGEGIAQVLFFENEEACEVSYNDRAGKYQGHTDVTPPRV